MCIRDRSSGDPVRAFWYGAWYPGHVYGTSTEDSQVTVQWHEGTVSVCWSHHVVLDHKSERNLQLPSHRWEIGNEDDISSVMKTIQTKLIEAMALKQGAITVDFSVHVDGR